ncbi:uncharacterized protein [Aegilops tauschii subsp. strangulata]|uniref:uncharacterized protein n=1 Tax=Aegilops tauschii subsp. strangulata TaxID=200361 RepID=UPI003CC8BF62
MAKSWNILNWNVRGLNDDKKHTAIANIEQAACSILCLQETKRELFDSNYLRNFFPRQLNEFDYVPSVGASGGLLVVWNDHLFSGTTIEKTAYSISIEFTSKHNGDNWILTTVYGHCQHSDRLNFLDWFQSVNILDFTNWMAPGDFNYIRYPQDRNREGGNVQDMLAFNEAISQLALIEVPLKGRSYT